MSDFSAAYHLKTDNDQDVVDLFNRSNLTGYLFDPQNGWTTFVTEIDEFSPDSKVTDFNVGTLIFFSRTNDFLGWGFEIFEDKELIGKYSIELDENENLKINNNLDEEKLLKIIDSSKITNLIELLNPQNIETAYKFGDYEFANLLGLVNIEFTSFWQIDCNVEDYDVYKIE